MEHIGDSVKGKVDSVASTLQPEVSDRYPTNDENFINDFVVKV